jgi:hypothetical protein
VVVLSVVVLVVNDHWLKARLGPDPRLGVVTGKLSDVAGLVFFPLVLVSIVELVRGRAASRAEVTGAVVLTGVAFAAIKLVPVAAGAYTGGLAALRWLPAGLAGALTAAPPPSPPRIHHVMDVTDCLSLPALWLGHRIGVRGRREHW